MPLLPEMESAVISPNAVPTVPLPTSSTPKVLAVTLIPNGTSVGFHLLSIA
jgi:hypothetical protein